FYPSIAANGKGKFVIAFNGCGPRTFITCYAAVGEIIQNTTHFGDLLTIKSGTASYQLVPAAFTTRWGDYTAACVDPSDPDRFWVALQYPSSHDAWSTQLTEILTSNLLLNIALSGASVVVSWPELPTPATLQQTSAFSVPGSWADVTQTPSTNARTVSVTLPLQPNARFFRLVQP